MAREPGQAARPHSAHQKFWVVCAVLVVSAGCTGVKARDAVIRNAFRDHREIREAQQSPTGSFAAVLASEGLIELAESDPAAAATRLEERIRKQPHHEGVLALAELSYRAALERQHQHPDEAITWFRDSAALSSLAIQSSPTVKNGEAVQLHNRSVARLLRLAQAEGKHRDGGWQKVLNDRGVVFESPTPDLAPARFADLLLTEDVEVEGMQHLYKYDGYGVALVAHRRVEPSESTDPLDRFHPRELRLPATAVVTPVGGLEGMAWRSHPTTLALLDPFIDRAVMIGEHEVTLAGDRTTPLAIQVTQGSLPTLEMTGLFDSDFKRPGVKAGLYLFRPYVPGKIPVVLVHGLFSSPRAFLQTINELENDPEIASRFQFWVFLYPTGLPIPASAMQLRISLNRIREDLDPGHADPSMDRMVLIGHSMGGLLSKMMVQQTGLTLWDATFNRPPMDLKASPETRRILDDSLIFQPLPFIQRVVFIATPHRGSPIADQWFGRIIASMIRRNNEEAEISRELVERNGPDLIAPEFRRMPLNAISNLRTDSKILKALDQIPINPAVPYHSIIPQIAGRLPTDGVVPYPSSHLDGARSELIVPGTHSAQQDPDVTAELRRILKLHLTER